MQVYAACLPRRICAQLVSTESCVEPPSSSHVLHVQTESTTNTSKRRRALEVLIRKLLTLPNSPALVYLHWWSPTTNQVC